MNSRFDYKDALNEIKASLFDIYENQEQEIGLEENEEKRNTRLNKFIEVKNVALMLIEGIEYLYEDDVVEKSDYILEKKLENPSISEEVEESKILNLVENIPESSIKNEIEVDTNIDDSSDLDVDNVDDNSVESSDFVEEEEQELEEQTEEVSEDFSENDNDHKKKYYLTCDIENVNFAYVPQELYKKIRDNGNLGQDEVDTNIDDSNIYKVDSENVRGIIVRSDQYMKLALSKHRQEGVLEEAKQFRIEQVKRKRREEQQKELEKAEVKIDI